MLFRVAEYKKLEELLAYKVSSDPCPSMAGEACKMHDNGCAAASHQCGVLLRVSGLQYHLVDVPYRVSFAAPHHHHAFRGPRPPLVDAGEALHHPRDHRVPRREPGSA